MLRLFTAAPALSLALCLIGAGGAGHADAAVIYRWVDKEGRTHFSDVVPPAYRDVARPVDAGGPAPSPEERQRALDRAAQDKARAAAISPPAAAPAASASAPASSPAARRPPQAPGPDTDCETWRRLYRESLDCFGPFRTVGGGIKPEAFEQCTPVPQPPPRCGRNPTRDP